MPQYSNQDIIQAIAAVRNGLTFREAEEIYKVPKGTIVRKIKKANFEYKKPGPSTTLTAQEEEYLVKWLKHCQDAGFPQSQLIATLWLPQP